MPSTGLNRTGQNTKKKSRNGTHLKRVNMLGKCHICPSPTSHPLQTGIERGDNHVVIWPVCPAEVGGKESCWVVAVVGVFPEDCDHPWCYTLGNRRSFSNQRKIRKMRLWPSGTETAVEGVLLGVESDFGRALLANRTNGNPYFVEMRGKETGSTGPTPSNAGKALSY